MLLFSVFYISANSHVPGHRAQSLPGARGLVGPEHGEEASSLLPRTRQPGVYPAGLSTPPGENQAVKS